MKLCESCLNFVPVYSHIYSYIVYVAQQFANLHAIAQSWMSGMFWIELELVEGKGRSSSKKALGREVTSKLLRVTCAMSSWDAVILTALGHDLWSMTTLNAQDHTRVLPWTTARPVYTKDPKISKVDSQRVRFTTHFRWKIAGTIWSPL